MDLTSRVLEPLGFFQEVLILRILRLADQLYFSFFRTGQCWHLKCPSPVGSLLTVSTAGQAQCWFKLS